MENKNNLKKIKNMFNVPEKYRITIGNFATNKKEHGNNGHFKIDRNLRTTFGIVASDGAGWDHVSVVAYSDRVARIPTWSEMCFIKNLFWSPNDTVVQFHPSKENYVNCHPFCLHLWRVTGHKTFPLPSPLLIGFNNSKI